MKEGCTYSGRFLLQFYFGFFFIVFSLSLSCWPGKGDELCGLADGRGLG